ncbi:NAD(P)/FAD-dependent oxidoreductase [uncultured Sphaerochaeta sp.]|uniref:NAD(P)/FAD-dependent oxidoreductase n=1 Tax=uncultured Sphaerochaeta sp. TaxID=886478 RepID=UPI0029CA6C34|nr:NAD(P)/FAD-dependent oxidoreductase [uncultured Sphaerochaeta sp.]
MDTRNTLYDVVIIGGGAAGLFLAANLPTSKALLIEHKESAGKKILITGGGMCNLTNTKAKEDFLQHYGSRAQRNFLLPSFQAFPPTSLIGWFESKGVSLVTREDGKVFPASLDAHEIRDILVRESKARILYNSTISSLCKDGEYFHVQTDNGSFTCKNLVLATGGMSYPITGSDGSGYKLAKTLGHSIVPPKPALAAIMVDTYQWTHLAGNAIRSSYAEFHHPGEKKRFLQATGDILFTHDGLSGPLILTASRELKAGDSITFSLLPMENKREVQEDLLALLSSQPKKQISNILKEAGLVTSLAQQVVRELSLDPTSTPAHLNKARRQDLIKMVTERRFVIKGIKGFNAAMVTCGGVSLKEVDRNNMQSKVVEHLYFCGEVLDVDGQSGGYNLQAAFSTAYCVAEHIQE